MIFVSLPTEIAKSVVHGRSAEGKSIEAENAIISLFFPYESEIFQGYYAKGLAKMNVRAHKRTAWIKMLGGHYASVRLRYDKQSLDFYCFEFSGEMRNNNHKFLFPLRVRDMKGASHTNGM